MSPATVFTRTGLAVLPVRIAATAAPVEPVPELAVHASATWSRWSGYRTIHDEAPDPALDDVLDVRAALEWSPRSAVTLRGGWAFLPTPLPGQPGRTNFIDADRHEIGMGVGLDLEAAGWARMRVDVHLRWHVLAVQRVRKDALQLPDDDDDVPGHQIDNLGYPGFSSGGRAVQTGVTLTFPLAPREPASGGGGP